MSERIYWPTHKDTSSDMPVMITPLLKDIQVVLVNATLLAQIYRDTDCADQALEDALRHIGQQVARAQAGPRRYLNGGDAA
jgi:hypothetical protein